MTAELLQNAADCWTILAVILLASVLHRRAEHPFERLHELILTVILLAWVLRRSAKHPYERVCELLLAWFKR